MDDHTVAAETAAHARELRALYRAAEQRAVRFRLLVEMGRDLANTHEPAALLHLALVRATIFSGSDAGAMLIRDGAGELHPPASFALRGAGAPALSPEAVDQARLALAEGGPLMYAGRGDQRLFLPLLPGDGPPLGVLMLVGSAPGGPPDADDLEALQLLAALLAGELRRAQLAAAQDELVVRLSEREQRLADLVEQLVLAQEDERRRVAYELHDGLAQMSLGVLQQLHVLAESYRPRRPRARQTLERAVEMARSAVSEARRVIAGLRPTVLDDFGLAQALQLQVEALQREGWEVCYEQQLGAAPLSPAQETALFRILQEALQNVRKHAGTTSVRVALLQGEQAVTLAVQDWGRGFAQDVGASSGVGLASMSERVALFDGRLRIESSPGRGTLVEVTLPLGGATRGGQAHG